jgi:hypothetical protein
MRAAGSRLRSNRTRVSNMSNSTAVYCAIGEMSGVS